MSAFEISLQHAKQNKLFYYVATVVVYRESDGRCLLLKRSDSEKVHPGKYCVPGGKLEWANLDLNSPTRLNGEVKDYEKIAEALLKREVWEEAGLEIESELIYINNIAFVRPDGIPVVSTKFAVKYKSGEVKLEEGAFSDFVWVNEEEVDDYDCILGIKEEVKQTIDKFKLLKK